MPDERRELIVMVREMEEWLACPGQVASEFIQELEHCPDEELPRRRHDLEQLKITLAEMRDA